MSAFLHTLSLHDALPISKTTPVDLRERQPNCFRDMYYCVKTPAVPLDRKSTRLNSSHRCISYAVFCLKKNIELSPDFASDQLSINGSTIDGLALKRMGSF